MSFPSTRPDLEIKRFVETSDHEVAVRVLGSIAGELVFGKDYNNVKYVYTDLTDKITLSLGTTSVRVYLITYVDSSKELMSTVEIL